MNNSRQSNNPNLPNWFQADHGDSFKKTAKVPSRATSASYRHNAQRDHRRQSSGGMPAAGYLAQSKPPENARKLHNLFVGSNELAVEGTNGTQRTADTTANVLQTSNNSVRGSLVQNVQ